MKENKQTVMNAVTFDVDFSENATIKIHRNSSTENRKGPYILMKEEWVRGQKVTEATPKNCIIILDKIEEIGINLTLSGDCFGRTYNWTSDDGVSSSGRVFLFRDNTSIRSDLNKYINMIKEKCHPNDAVSLNNKLQKKLPLEYRNNENKSLLIGGYVRLFSRRTINDIPTSVENIIRDFTFTV